MLTTEAVAALAEPIEKGLKGSAGGFTVLSALAFHNIFTAGASLYGVADLEALANDTHKFESRYLDKLIGKWPEDADIYAQRSPINHLDGFKAPMIILQGSDDAIVPPNQSRMIFNALDELSQRIRLARLMQHWKAKPFDIFQAFGCNITGEYNCGYFLV